MEKKSKKKILIFGKLPPPYMGPAIATQILLNSDLKNRFDLTHFNNTLNKKVDTIGKFEIIKIFLTLKLYFNFCLKILSLRPDIILIPISQSTMGFIKDTPFIWISKIFGKNTLIQLRGSNLKNWLKESSLLTNFLFKKTVKNLSGVIVLGESLKYLFLDYFPSNKIFVVPNGGNYVFPKKTNSEQGIRILYLAQLFKSKGIKDVVDAAILMNNQNYEFIVAGGWDDDLEFKKEILQKIENSQINIKVLPPVSGQKKFQLYADADIFVFPPVMPEGHPWVIVESMAAGLPIISTDQGAIIECVLDERNGFIIEPNRPDLIVDKISFLIKNKEIREKMGIESRALYEQSFTEEKMVENYTEMFSQIA